MYANRLIKGNLSALLLRPVGVRSIAISLSVRLCVSLFASTSLEPLDRSSRNLICGSPVPWLGPPLAALGYIMYFRFYG